MSEEKRELRKAGLKATLPRVRILETLEENAVHERHMSAEDIYRVLLESGEDVGLATVYRVMTQFEAAGLVQRHRFETGHSVFELASDQHHDHMICIDSGEVVEFIDDEIERRQREVAASKGYDLVDHTLVLYVKKKTV